MVNMRKAAMIGCGFVGSSSAFALMQSGIFSEMVMIDVNREKAEGEAMDIAHGLPFARPIRLYAGTYDDIVDAAIIIITAGANQKPDETRLDLIHKNVEIYKTIIPRNVRLAEAPSHGMPVNKYDSKSTGAESYRLLAEEVIHRGEDDEKKKKKEGLERDLEKALMH